MTITAELKDDPDFGFVVTCKKCKSNNIKFENDFGFSAQSGSWGGIELTCTDCGNSTQLVGS